MLPSCMPVINPLQVLTAISFLLFSRENVDVAIVEIKDCMTRYNGDMDQQRRKKFSFPARLICADCYEDERYRPLMSPLPSYGYGREHRGPQYGSLIHGQDLKDVTITDSCENVMIKNCYISVGDDGIAIKSCWDQYGISYGRPSTNITIYNVRIRSMVSAGVSIGSEMSGGVSNILVENVHIWDSRPARCEDKDCPWKRGLCKQHRVPKHNPRTCLCWHCDDL